MKLRNDASHLRKEIKDIKQTIIDSCTDAKHNVSAAWLKSITLDDTAGNLSDDKVRDIKETIENNCLLFFTLGKEINNLLQDAHKKDKQLMYQKEVIEFLTETVIFFYDKFKEMHIVSSKYKCMENGEESSELKNRIEELEKECKAQKEAILEAKNELETLDKRANEYLSERDDYKCKHTESVQVIEELWVKLKTEQEDFDRKRKANEETIQCLRKQNEECEMCRCNRDVILEDVEEYRRKQVSFETLQGDFENVRQEHRQSLEQILILDAENRSQNEKIEELKEALRQRDQDGTSGNLEDSGSYFGSSKESDKGSKSQSSTGTWSTTETTTEQLEDTIHQLSGTVSKMMEGNKDVDQHIAELEETLAKTMREREIERGKRNQEVINLKQTILELEKALRNAHIRAESLQKAVDLYQNSVNVLEASEERARIEMSQQRQTIANLQEALVASKHQLEELQQKTTSEIHRNIESINDLNNVLLSVENRCILYCKEIQIRNQLIEDLRDTNLDLEVQNFGYVQDVAMLETRLLKYQQLCKLNEDCICGLKNELMQLHSENKHHINTISCLKQQVNALTCELHSLQNAASESNNLQKMLEKANEELHHQVELSRQKLIRETKINEINAKRIEELQQMLGEKTLELNRYEDQYHNTQRKLDLTLHTNKELKGEHAQLLERIKSYEQESVMSEERTDYCHKEIETCRDNLNELKDKLMRMKELLQQKIEQYNKLETEFCIQNNTLSCLKQQMEGSKSHYEGDVADLKHTIQELNEKLTKTENNYHNLHEDFKRSQAQVIAATHQHGKLHNDKLRCEKEFAEKLQVIQNEEQRLNDCITQLEAESSILRTELINKDRQISVAQEEITNLKNELNKVIHRHNKLKTEHEKLHAECSHLKESTLRCEQHSHVTDEQLNQCLNELQGVQDEKDRLETKNKHVKKELQTLQAANREMERKYRHLNESVVTLEMELVDHKISRNEICEESRNVITNVRTWLQDQVSINEQLTQKLRHDENVIDKLKQHIAFLQSKCKCKCKCRQRGGGTSVEDRSLVFASVGQSQRALWSPGSQGSGSISPNSIISNNQDWYMYEEFEEEYLEDNPSLSRCLKKVESINQELQKSNQFWQSKMVENDYAVTRDQ